MKILNAFTSACLALAGMDCVWKHQAFVVVWVFCFFNFIGLYDLLVLAYGINSVSKFKMSGSSWFSRLVQGQSDESTLLTGGVLTSPGRYPDGKHH